MRTYRSARALALFLMLGLSAGLAACASGGGGGGGGNDGPRRSANLITAEELADYHAVGTLEVIRRLRPRWLQPRGGAASSGPVAILDGTRLGGMQELQRINVADIVSMRFLSASDATTRYGTGFDAGAVEVTTR